MTLTPQQRADLTTLLARSVPRPNLMALAASVMGGDALAGAGNEIGSASAFVARVIELLEDNGRMTDFLAVLREDMHRDAWLIPRLNHILAGGRLDDQAALQRLVNVHEPFFSALEFAELLPRMYHTVCALAIGSPRNDIVGTGFLIAADLVLTNHHVLEEVIELRDGGYRAKPGSEVFCIFDYLMAPAPMVPPDAAGAHRCVIVRAADDWLEHARELLPYDGTPLAESPVASRYDYAVVRLSRPVGRQPARQGTTRIRGWLPLQEQIDVELPVRGERRVLVFQHPERLPQRFDVGSYTGLDTSQTRVRYSVSTAHGSSGGAAVDTKGRLFALHNAEVIDGQRAAGAAIKLNQGIRIDEIAKDLSAAAPDLIRELKEAGDPAVDTRIWSLSDNPADPQPIIGRTRFRDNVAALRMPTGPRVMVVTGPSTSGVRFSINLLRRTLGTQVPVVVFTPTELQRLSPKDFLRVLVDELGLRDLAQHPIPEPLATEQLARWLRMDLPAWLADRFADDQKDSTRLVRYPAWVVINTVTPADERLLWADQLKDFVAALAGVRDAGQSAVDIPQLRWLFLARRGDALPIPGGALHDEDLSKYESWENDFVDCLGMAWLTVEKQAALPPLLQQTLAGDYHDKAAAEGVPLRQALAEGVRRLITRARARAAAPPAPPGDNS